MMSMTRSAFADTLLSLFRRPPVLQLAALCHRKTKRGREVLLITSSHGRWILPKGWPIEGKSSRETALAEAWVERHGKRTSFYEGHLQDEHGTVLAKATSTILLADMSRVVEASKKATGE